MLPNRRFLHTTCGCAAIALITSWVSAAADSTYLSPVSLCANADGSHLYIAESTGGQVVAFDVSAQRVVETLAVGGPPTGVCLSPDGKRLYATVGGAEGKVWVIDVAKWKKRDTYDVGHTPGSPQVTPDGKTLYVCNRFNNDISVLSTRRGRERARIPVPREPIAAVLTPDGTRLFVANHLPTGRADGPYTAAAVSVVDTAKRVVIENIQLPNGSTDLRDICISPDGAYVYVTHILARYQLPTTQLERGWMNTNAFTVIDAKAATTVNTVLLDDVDLGAANPWGVVCTGDGKYLCVAHSGTHEVSVVDLARLHEMLTTVAGGKKVTEVSKSPDDVPNDLSFLVDVRRRLRLNGNGPRGITAVGGVVYTAEYFTDSVGVLDTDPEKVHRPKSLPIGPEIPMTTVRRGEMLFCDATMCFQKWQSCSSCHPDARADGLNWDLLNDGMGNPKQTKSLVLSHATPPAMVTGIRDSAEVGVRAGMRYIQFVVRPEEDAVAIDEYLKSLRPLPSPHRVKGKLSREARRGQKVFTSAGCVRCHPPPLFTDMNVYDVGTGTHMEEDQTFDTPALAENWRTGPLLYDGRAATVEEVITEHNGQNRHGRTRGLSPKQISDLVAYVLSQ